MSQTKTALVIVMSPITRDPRVRRQIDWLNRDGWIVDTVGPAGHHVEHVREHFGLAPQASWVTTKVGSVIVYGMLPMRAKFRVLLQRLIPREVKSRIKHGTYDLVIFNDHHFLPWIAEKRTFTRAALSKHIHLDIHEYVTPRVERDSLWRRFAGPYYDWIRTFIGDHRFTTRSTVVRGISELYAQEFSIPTPAVIRNCPPYVEQEPAVVDGSEVKLLHHGAASWNRGLYEMIDAMRVADERFTLTLMLVGTNETINTFQEYAGDLGKRVQFVDPVPMPEIATAVNRYDLEIMFFPPRNRNLEFALPNKLFEAIQGRLGIVIGESPMMAEVIEQYNNGIIVAGWNSEDLGNALNALTSAQVTELKAASGRAAKAMSAETERRVFFELLAADER